VGWVCAMVRIYSGGNDSQYGAKGGQLQVGKTVEGCGWDVWWAAPLVNDL